MSKIDEVYLGEGLYVAWTGKDVTFSQVQGHTEELKTIGLSPEVLGRFMDWLHDTIQSNPEGAVFTRDGAP